MSDELVRRVFAAFNARDPDAWAELMTPDGTFKSAYWGIDGRTYSGRDGFAEYFEEMGQQWENYALELVRIVHGEGKSVAVAKLVATEPETHVAVSPEQGFLFEFVGDRVAKLVTIPNVDEALAQL